MKPPLLLFALAGLGDNIHGRAIVPKLCEQYNVWLKTKHPQVFADMPEVHFDWEHAPETAQRMTLGYVPQHVRRCGSVVEAMGEACQVKPGNFLLPCSYQQLQSIMHFLARHGYKAGGEKRLLVYRPLVAVAETPEDNVRSKLARNPDSAAYCELVVPVRERYFTVSVADCRDRREVILPSQVQPDLDLTHGELNFVQLVALFSLADLVFCSPGFAVVLAQAVCTPSICVFGGFEDAWSFATGAAYAPWLPIHPINPCPCWSPECPADKEIDIPVAARSIAKFVGGLHDYWQV